MMKNKQTIIKHFKNYDKFNLNKSKLKKTVNLKHKYLLTNKQIPYRIMIMRYLFYLLHSDLLHCSVEVSIQMIKVSMQLKSI